MPAPSSDGRGKWKRRKRESDSDSDDGNHNNYADPAQFPDPTISRAAAAVEVLAAGGVRVSDFPPVTKRDVTRPHGSVLAVVAAERANLCGDVSVGSSGGLVPSLENLSCGQMAALSAVPAESADRFVVTPPPIMEGKGVVKRFGDGVLVVPMYSDWFAPSTVHRLERQVVPRFFSGKSPDHTPEKYMECRNHIVAKYMENPDKRLTVLDCQGLITGIGEEELVRIIRFLDHWGIINYCAAAPGRETWNDGVYLKEEFNGDVHVPSAALKSIDSLIKFDKPICRLNAADHLSDLDIRIREQLSENRCNYCGHPLLAVYYQSHQDDDMLLCCECFHDGRFVTGHSSLDFFKMEPAKDYSDPDGESWTDQETFRLLEAVEIYNENWNGVADHVGSKSKSQCILHFLRLPVEDGLFEDIKVPTVSKLTSSTNEDDWAGLHSSSNGSRAEDNDIESRLPFANSENPVMALVGFLASAIGPRIAAACARASLAALSEDSSRMNADIQGSNPGEISAEKVEAAARAGLAAAATKGKLFADHEEREIQRNSAILINHQFKRLDLKLNQLEDVENLLTRECDQVEKMRHRVSAERVRLQSIDMGPILPAPLINRSGVDAASFLNNRPQMMPAPSSLPSISGFGSSQQVRPQMPFMQQRSMFPLGPRLPLSAIQPSSSANAMFNPSGNSQPNLNQILRSVSGSSSGLG